MKKSILIFFFALLGILSVQAYDFEVDGIYYNFISGTDNQVEVTYQNYNSGSPISDYSGSVVIPATVTYSGNTYRVTSIKHEAFHNCRGLTSVTIPESVTSIGYSAFFGCSGLISVTIPESVTEIDNSAFAYCSGLTSMTIGEGVTSISGRAFLYCKNLTSVTIPESVTFIGYSAFADCTGLTSVTSLSENPPVCSSSVFSDHSATLYVPKGCKEAYQAADDWREFSKIEELNMVTLSATDGGTVAGGGQYKLDEQVTLTATPNEGYRFVNWTKADGSEFSTESVHTFTVTESLELMANFLKTFTVGVSANSTAWGSATITGNSPYDTAASVTITATPNEGYRFVNWTKVDGTEFSTESVHTFTVTESLELMANFLKTFTVSVSANNAARGSATITGNSPYVMATSVTITATPNEGYRFVNWTKADGTEFSTEEVYSFTVTENLELTANFEEIPPVVVKTYTVSVSANNAAWGNVSQSGTGTYDSATSVTITATPNEGYRFINWTKDNEVFGTDSMYTFTVTENLELTAHFEEIPPVVVVKTYTVSISANNAAWGSVAQSGTGTYDSAATVTLTATPNEGYRFVNWTKSNEVFSTDSLHTFIITGNLELLANFEKMPDTPIDPDTPTANENAKADNIRVYVQGRTIHLSEDRGTVQVYNMAGQRVYNGHATAIPISHSGVYIVVTGSQRLKVSVR